MIIIKRILLSISLVFVIILTGCGDPIDPDLTDPSKNKKALKIAYEQLGSPYVWGGRGPDVFDCSGLITYSYKQAYNKNNIFNIDSWVTSDATIQDLYDWNVKYISKSKVKPGDIIFMTTKENKLTHGGMFIEWVQKYEKFKFIHATSYPGIEEVIIDTWHINKMDRELRFVGIGRFQPTLTY